MTRRLQRCGCERCKKKYRRIQKRKNRRKQCDSSNSLPIQNSGSISSIDQTCSIGDICGNNICIIIAPQNSGNSSSLNKSDHNKLENTKILSSEDDQSCVVKNQLTSEQFDQIMAVINGN